MDGKVQELDPTSVEEVLPFRPYFTSPGLKPSILGLLCHQGKIFPVVGVGVNAKTAELSNIWYLREKHQVRLIRGLPRFKDEIAAVPDLKPAIVEAKDDDLDFIEELIKSA